MIDKENDQMMELYKIMVSSSVSNEQKRMQANSLYFTLTLALLTAASSIKEPSYVFFSLLIAIISGIWFQTIRNYKNLAQAKFKVIADFEENFDKKIFALEEKYLTELKGSKDKGKKKDPFRLSNIEMLLPQFLFVGSVCYLFYALLFQNLIFEDTSIFSYVSKKICGLQG